MQSILDRCVQSLENLSIDLSSGSESGRFRTLVFPDEDTAPGSRESGRSVKRQRFTQGPPGNRLCSVASSLLTPILFQKKCLLGFVRHCPVQSRRTTEYLDCDPQTRGAACRKGPTDRGQRSAVRLRPSPGAQLALMSESQVQGLQILLTTAVQ